MITKNDKFVYLIFIFLSILYFQNVFRLKLNSLEQKIDSTKEMIAYSKSQPSKFKGDKDFYVLLKPLVLCGMIEQKRWVLELTDLEILNIYKESTNNKNAVLLFYRQKKYIVKDGQLLVSGDDNKLRALNKAYFYQDARNIYLAGPGLLFTNINCYQMP